jgi:hypothetical protein
VDKPNFSYYKQPLETAPLRVVNFPVNNCLRLFVIREEVLAVGGALLASSDLAETHSPPHQELVFSPRKIPLLIESDKLFLRVTQAEMIWMMEAFDFLR